MKTLINILCVTLAITFVSVEVQANPGLLLKGAKIIGTLTKAGVKVHRGLNTPAPHIKKVFDSVKNFTQNEKSCRRHNNNINDEKYFNSLLEELPKEDNENSDSDETLSSDTKELKMGCKWENSHCRCFQKKQTIRKTERLPRNKLKGFVFIEEALKQKVEEGESDQ